MSPASGIGAQVFCFSGTIGAMDFGNRNLGESGAEVESEVVASQASPMARDSDTQAKAGSHKTRVADLIRETRAGPKGVDRTCQYNGPS